jgi:hypothetical protein
MSRRYNPPTGYAHDDSQEDGEILRELHEIKHELHKLRHQIHQSIPHLASIKIDFQFKGAPYMAIPGPITLVTVGQTVTASVVGYDQFGQVFTGELPAVTFTSDDASGSIVTLDGSAITDVANGVANITATLTTAEGVALTDTESVTVANPVVVPPAPVLSSIKVAFA